MRIAQPTPSLPTPLIHNPIAWEFLPCFSQIKNCSLLIRSALNHHTSPVSPPPIYLGLSWFPYRAVSSRLTTTKFVKPGSFQPHPLSFCLLNQLSELGPPSLNLQPRFSGCPRAPKPITRAETRRKRLPHYQHHPAMIPDSCIRSHRDRSGQSFRTLVPDRTVFKPGHATTEMTTESAVVVSLSVLFTNPRNTHI